MRIALKSTRRKAVVGTLAVVLGVAASLGLPALADENHATGETNDQVDRIADDGSIIPESESDALDENPIDSRAELVEIEKTLDPAGSSAFFICADEGADVYTVIAGYGEVPEDAKVNPNAGPLEKDSDPCAGRDWVVGN